MRLMEHRADVTVLTEASQYHAGAARPSLLQPPATVADSHSEMNISRLITLLNLTHVCPVTASLLPGIYNILNSNNIKTAFVEININSSAASGAKAAQGVRQRNYIFSDLIGILSLDDSVLLVSDADEIIRREYITRLRLCPHLEPSSPWLLLFLMRHYLYNFNRVVSDFWGFSHGDSPFAISPHVLRRLTAEDTAHRVRRIVAPENRALLLKLCRTTDILIWMDSGWHVSAFKSPLLTAKSRNNNGFDRNHVNGFWREEYSKLMQDLGIPHSGLFSSGNMNAVDLLRANSVIFSDVRHSNLPVAVQLDTILYEKFSARDVFIDENILRRLDDLIQLFNNISLQKTDTRADLNVVYMQTDEVLETTTQISCRCTKEHVADELFIRSHVCCSDKSQCKLHTYAAQCQQIIDFVTLNCEGTSNRNITLPFILS